MMIETAPISSPETFAAADRAFSSATARLHPLLVAALAPVAEVAAAEAATRALAGGHYENFSVVSMLLPKRLRQDFCNIYAFCRIADDLGDEIGDPARSLELLSQFAQMTRECFAGRTRRAVFVALAATIRRHDIPIQPFLDLISAFEQDQRVTRYQTWEQAVDYCRRSADPVGRLVLYLFGYRDEVRQKLSDKICTALQLTNFWQDVRRDLIDRNRIYLPEETLSKFGVTEEQLRDQIRAGKCDDNYRSVIRFEVERTERLFDVGEQLLPLLDREVRPQITLFGKGGRAILKAIRRREFDTITGRPSLSRWQKGRLVLGTLAACAGSALLGKRDRGHRA